MSFSSTISKSIKNILSSVINGNYPARLNNSGISISFPKESNLFADGVKVSLGQDRNLASDPQERNLVTLTPKSSILIKKKAFSTLKNTNDLQWLDRTEKMLLRATKALFAYKVAQIRAYESLTRVEDYFRDSFEVNLSLLAELYHNAQFLSVDPNFNLDDGLFQQIISVISASVDSDSIREAGYEGIKQDVLRLLERNAFAGEIDLTTWIVDPNDTDNYETGPGTGVIEIGIYTDLNTTVNLNTEPSSAIFTLEDPYRIMNITEGDIEIAIEEALLGTLGLLNNLADPSAPALDTRSILGAGMELLGLGALDDSIDINYIRDRLRVFYLGKPIVNAGDGVHIYIRGNKTVHDFSEELNSFDQDYLAIDETILEAERILYTNKSIDFDTYKRIRQFSDSSFGMRHVFGGFVNRIDQSWSQGSWKLKVSCTDNMGWLMWSRFMINPSLQDPQGILEDPLTPYEIKTDATGTVLAAGGPQLLEENRRLIKSGLLYYDSGILNGRLATENNLLQGQFNRSGSLSGAKIMQHPHGLVYRWKQGIITATAGVYLTDPLQEDKITQKLHNQTYGLTVAENVLNNLDIANILSILIVGQPYNVETFIDQAYKANNISNLSGSLSNTDPLSAVLDVVRRQNNHFGDFRPYRMITLSSQTLLQTANTNILRNELNLNIRQLQNRRTQLDSLIRRLEESENPQNKVLINTLVAEKASIQLGISSQIETLNKSGNVSSRDLITENFNLFGRSKTLPLTGNYTADHQITRAMTLLGAQRRIEDVRLNRDQNLLIISDQYDEQTDIRPFIFKLSGSDYKIFKGDFVSIYKKCNEAANFINMEFFCNTQGHLEFRPPQWNKTPLSILERLFEINNNSNKKLVPEFLTEIFTSRSGSLRREIHSLNIRIVLLSLLMNKYPDRQLIPNFNASVGNIYIPAGSTTGKKSLKFFGVKESGDDGELSLRFSQFSGSIGSSISTGSQVLGDGATLDAGLGKDGDILNGDTRNLLGNFDPIYQESVGLVNDVLTVASQGSSQVAKELANPNSLNSLREAFVRLSGLDPASDLVSENGRFVESSFIFNNGFEGPNAEANNIEKANGYLKKLQETISKRDNLVTILQRNEEKMRELNEVEEILSGEFTRIRQDVEGGIFADITNYTNDVLDVVDRANNTIKTISDIFTGDSQSGTLFDHLVADDRRNLLGPGSGKRYIIQDHDIISCSFSEEPPSYCKVDVVGDAPIIGSGLNSSFEERYFWAGATDFDLWRQYGFQTPGSISLPFANDPENQSKPYAILELQLQRIKINKGSVTIVGNEYYEPGDTVYIPVKELLYYVRSVSHNYTEGGQFTTNLTLEFGHPPGNYLPSPLDIIGQQYTKDPLTGNILTYRNINGDDSYRPLQPDSALVFPNQEITEDNIAYLLDYKNNAVRFTNMMADLSSIITQNRYVLLRGFVTERGGEQERKVRNNLDIVKNLLQNPVSLTQGESLNAAGLLDEIFDVGSSASNTLGTGAGTTKGTTPLILPNGLPVLNISAEKIIQQIVYLDGENTYSEIKCLSPNLLSDLSVDDRSIDSAEYQAVLPKGGPKQRTWLDIRSNTSGDEFSVNPLTFRTSTVVEIGILNVDRSLKPNIKKGN